jgi:hypothetical protein
MKEVWGKIYNDIKRGAREWSAINYAFDAGLTFLLSTIISFAASMPLSITIVVRRFATAEPQSVVGAKSLIRQLARLIPEPKSGLENMAEHMATAQLKMLAPPPRDWKVETSTAIRIIVRPEIATDYDVCLQNDNPNYTAKLFLLTLADSLCIPDLRGSATP